VWENADTPYVNLCGKANITERIGASGRIRGAEFAKIVNIYSLLPKPGEAAGTRRDLRCGARLLLRFAFSCGGPSKKRAKNARKAAAILSV
jgi:hypothetical protein